MNLRASRLDLCFALATEIMSRLRGAVTVQDEVHGFKYFDERDLLGFVDGTENPRGPEDPPELPSEQVSGVDTSSG